MLKQHAQNTMKIYEIVVVILMHIYILITFERKCVCVWVCEREGGESMITLK